MHLCKCITREGFSKVFLFIKKKRKKERKGRKEGRGREGGRKEGRKEGKLNPGRESRTGYFLDRVIRGQVTKKVIFV